MILCFSDVEHLEVLPLSETVRFVRALEKRHAVPACRVAEKASRLAEENQVNHEKSQQGDYQTRWQIDWKTHPFIAWSTF